MEIVEMIGVGLLVLIYAGSGLAELPRWRRLVDPFVRWGLPRWGAWFTPLCKLVAGLLVLLPATRPVGVVLCVLIGLAAAAVVLRARDLGMAKAALPNAGLTLLIGALLLT